LYFGVTVASFLKAANTASAFPLLFTKPRTPFAFRTFNPKGAPHRYFAAFSFQPSRASLFPPLSPIFVHAPAPPYIFRRRVGRRFLGIWLPHPPPLLRSPPSSRGFHSSNPSGPDNLPIFSTTFLPRLIVVWQLYPTFSPPDDLKVFGLSLCFTPPH